VGQETYLSVRTNFDGSIVILFRRNWPMHQKGVDMVGLQQSQRPLQAPFHIFRCVKVIPDFGADEYIRSRDRGIGSQELLDTGSNFFFIVIATIYILAGGSVSTTEAVCGGSYKAAQSRWRYPAFRAHTTALCVSPLLPWEAKVPNPREGIVTPLLRVRTGPVTAGAAWEAILCGILSGGVECRVSR